LDTGMQFAAPAEHYDRFMGRYAPTLAEALADFAGVGARMRMVDVGCGPGGLTRELVARVGAANVAAIDPALSSLVIGFMRDPDQGVREMARVTPCRAVFPDEQFTLEARAWCARGVVPLAT
jgi:ubiquinone/menaquinone biosynthesis C-methylase UbiE